MHAAKGKAVIRILAPTVALFLTALMIMRCDTAIFSSVAQWDAKEPISRVRRSDDMIALTFDSGWGEDYTHDILEILSERGIPATFFLTGYWMDENPDKVEEIFAAGHEIGGHSVTHSRMVGMSSGALDAEIIGVSDRIDALTGEKPKFFRPPYGDWDISLMERVRFNGQVAVTWSVDAQSPVSSAELDEALGMVRGGDIVLMSICDAPLKEELDDALELLAERGLKFGTVSELTGMLSGRYVDVPGMHLSRKAG